MRFAAARGSQDGQLLWEIKDCRSCNRLTSVSFDPCGLLPTAPQVVKGPGHFAFLGFRLNFFSLLRVAATSILASDTR